MSATDAQAIVDITLDAAAPNPLEPDTTYAIVVPAGGSVQRLDPVADKHLLNPRRPVGTTVVLDPDGFAQLWHKHAQPGISEIYADPKQFGITGLLNADFGVGQPAGHRDHRLVLQCVKTPAWEAWTARDGQLSDQTAFAEFLEDRLPEVVDPPGAQMLELAQSFQASTKVEFKSAVVLTSDQRSLQYEETTTARAGQKGAIDIPATFTVALQPFEGSAAYRVTARFRYRIRDGHLAIGYRLDRPEDVLREAFKDVRQAVDEATGQPSVLGIAPPPR